MKNQPNPKRRRSNRTARKKPNRAKLRCQAVAADPPLVGADIPDTGVTEAGEAWQSEARLHRLAEDLFLYSRPMARILCVLGVKGLSDPIERAKRKIWLHKVFPELDGQDEFGAGAPVLF